MAEVIGKDARISLPLYGAALVVTLCGVLTVASDVSDAAFTQEVITLTLAGFAFSLGCRALRINARLVEWLCLAVIVLAVGATLTERVDWGALVPVSASKSDARVAVILCWCAVLLSWALLHDSTLLFTPLLAVASIGLVASFDLNDYVAGGFITLLAAMIFLLTHFQSLRLREHASVTEQARAAPGQLTTQFALALGCALAVVALGLALLAPVEAVTRDLSLAGAIRRLGNIGGAAPGNPLATRFSDDTDFAIGTGEGWSASPQVLMHVGASDGQPHLWRGRTYDRYDGAGWHSTLDGQTRPTGEPISSDDGSVTYPLGAPAGPQRPALTASFDVLGDTDEFYYAATPRRLTLPMDVGIGPRFGLDGRLALTDGRPLDQMHYTVMSLVAPDPMDPTVQADLRRAGTDYPPDVVSLYLGNMGEGPDRGLDPRALVYFRRAVSEAVQGLPPARRTPIDEALALRAWVAAHCVYSLDVSPLSDRQDHVYQFLAHTRRGYCDLFASSLTVLCRVAGLPARVATGFAPGAQDGDEYDLRAQDKHAWTEVYFPGRGWLALDATIGTSTDGTVPNPALRRGWDWRGALHRLGALPLALGGAILALLLYVAKAEWYDRRRTLAAPTPGRALASRRDIGRRYERMSRALDGLGLPRAPAETPGEYAARARAFLTAQGPDAPDPATVAALTAQLVSARYGDGNGESDTGAEDALREFTGSALRLRLRRLARTLTRRTGLEGA